MNYYNVTQKHDQAELDSINYSDKIVTAYKKYVDIQLQVNYQTREYDPEMKKLYAKALRLMYKYEKICKAEGFKDSDIYKISTDLVKKYY